MEQREKDYDDDTATCCWQRNLGNHGWCKTKNEVSSEVWFQVKISTWAVIFEQVSLSVELPLRGAFRNT